MKPTYDTIYLSPHLDDAALSCGGQIYMLAQAGKAVLIATMMAGDPPRESASEYVQSLHDRWQLQTDAVTSRRAEDAAACRILGADYTYWDIPDCIYRSHPDTGEPLYNSDEDIFGDVHQSERDLVRSTAGCIKDLPPCDRLVAPLGVGNHVDHQLARLAAEQAAAANLVYYEEYPYASEPGAVEAVTRGDEYSWESVTIPLSEDALRAKIEAIAAYESQLSTFYRDLADMENGVRRYSSSIAGERVWRRV